MKAIPCHETRPRYRPKTRDGAEVLPSKEDQERMDKEAKAHMDRMIQKMLGFPLFLGGVAPEYIETEGRIVHDKQADI